MKACLAKHPRITLYFTPTRRVLDEHGRSLLRIITRQAICRGTFTSVPDLTGAIGIFIDAYNERCPPFTWINTADQFVATAHRREPSDTGHWSRRVAPPIRFTGFSHSKAPVDGTVTTSPDVSTASSG